VFSSEAPAEDSPLTFGLFGEGFTANHTFLLIIYKFNALGIQRLLELSKINV